MKKSEALDVLVAGLLERADQHIITWHGTQVPISLTGLSNDTPENQVAFLLEMATKGTLRLAAERVSATSVKTEAEAQERVMYTGEDGLSAYQMGARVGVPRYNSAEDYARSFVIRALSDEKSEKAKERREQFGLGIKTDKNGKAIGLTGTESEEFQAYLAETAEKEPFKGAGEKAWAEAVAKKEAKAAAKETAAAL